MIIFIVVLKIISTKDEILKKAQFDIFGIFQQFKQMPKTLQMIGIENLNEIQTLGMSLMLNLKNGI